MFLPLKKSNSGITAVLCALLLTQVSCKKDPEITRSAGTTPYLLEVPANFPAITFNPANPLTKVGVALGRKLYYDPILSNDGRACATCHDQKNSFTSFSSNALTHVNLAWSKNFLWNGKIHGTLEDAMDFEVGEFFRTDVARLNADPSYRNLFKQAFGVEEISRKEVSYALAQFFRILVSYNSKFDRFTNGAEDLTPSELNGYLIFNTEKGDCFHCHSLPLTTDNMFRNIGLDSVFNPGNQGRFEVTGNPADLGKFKVPSLRNIAFSAPYMHDGRFKTLQEVVEHYNAGVKNSATLDPIMTKPGKEHGLRLTSREKSDLISFLLTFTDTSFLNSKAFAKP